MRRLAVATALAVLALFALGGIAGASSPGSDVRLTNDCHPDAGCGAGYVSAYTLATGIPYTDQTLDECTVSKGRENEPSVAVDPKDTSVLLGSSNDYCGVYNQGAAKGAIGPTWLGYYRSQDSGSSWRSSLVPGYPDDTSPYAALSKARTAGAGDPVIAWDNHGRAYFGSESSDDPAGTPKTFGDVWVASFANPGGSGDDRTTANDGLAYQGTTVVGQGSSAPNLLGKFNDKTAIEVDRTGGTCDANVYFAWSRFTGNGGVGIYFSRSTDHGATFSSSMKLTASIHVVQFPDIAVTANGHVYVTFRQFASQGQGTDAVMIVKSTDCGQTFGQPQLLTTFTPSDAQDERAAQPIPTPQSQPDDPGFSDEGDAGSSTARDCGDFTDNCTSGYTFFRRNTQVRSTADQAAGNESIYIVYDATKDGTEVQTGGTYGTDGPGRAGQAAIYFLRYDGATGATTTPAVIDDEAAGHQVFPDISADGGVLHAIWWDSRNDSCYSVTRPIGNCADGKTTASLDVYGARSTDGGATWTSKSRITDVTTNPNYEQFDNRAVPFAGDYLWVTSVGSFAYTAWTDWRNTVQGTDQRETPEDADAATSDVVQCRTILTSPPDKKGNTTKSWSSDMCPHNGGLDQNIYGDLAP
jgi:hypothetical protein